MYFFKLQVLHGKLHVLDLTDSTVTDRGLSHIARICPQLRKIDLNAITKGPRSGVTDEGVNFAS